jgi:hypothetical protein
MLCCMVLPAATRMPWLLSDCVGDNLIGWPGIPHELRHDTAQICEVTNGLAGRSIARQACMQALFRVVVSLRCGTSPRGCACV